ncbi:MAG: aspartate aminotransferase family protein [Bacillota bacterium]|nr:aspartate aminotransferase family protein [Bacillota bacterium]
MANKLPGEVREVPGDRSQYFRDLLNRFESGGTSYRAHFDGPGRCPVFQSMDGVYVTDVDGNVYLETFGAYAASCLGYRPKELIAEVEDQINSLMHVADMPNPPRALLAQELVSIAPGELGQGKVQFEIGGGGAVDLALKLAEYYTPHPQHDIISFFGGYHGRTIGSVSVAANVYNRERVPSISAQVVRVPYPYCYRCLFEKEYPACDMFCTRYLAKLFESPEFGLYDPKTGTNLVSTLIVEPTQFHSGGIVPPKEFYPRLRELCDKYGIVFVDDEIAIGIGRSGYWFACEAFDTVPDVIVTSKALSGGIWPLSAVIARREIFAVWDERPDKHMGTWHGDPVGCRAALTVIREIKERNLLERCRMLGGYFLEGLKELQTRHRLVGEVSGIGLGLSMELVKDRRTKEPAADATVAVITEALRRGVLICRAAYYGNRMTFMPPYVITREEIDTILRVLDESLSIVERGL